MALGQGRGQSRESPAIYVAAFGKHPGWDDHIEDLGIETDVLARARRMLYSESISGNIDSGSWEKLADDQRLAGFAHDFVWWIAPTPKEPPHVIVGRLWSSRDGKGRSKYPMAVYAQGDGIPMAIMAREVLPALANVERRCVEATTADAVRAALETARAELRSRYAQADAARGGPQSPADVLSPAQVAAVVDREEFGPVTGPVREGFARSMYAVDRELGAFLPAAGEGRKSRSLSVKVGDSRGAHLRLPSLAPVQHEAALVWISLLARRVSEGTSILAIAPRGESFVDVVVGDVGPAQLYCIRASARGFPLTTEVPYAIDDAYRARVAQMASHWAGTAPPDQPAGSAEPTPAPAAAPTPAPAPKRRFPKLFVILGGVGVVVVGTIAALMSGGDDRDSGLAMDHPSEHATRLPPSPGPPAPAPAAPPSTPEPAASAPPAPAPSEAPDATADQERARAIANREGQEKARGAEIEQQAAEARARRDESERQRAAEQQRLADEAKAREEAARRAEAATARAREQEEAQNRLREQEEAARLAAEQARSQTQARDRLNADVAWASAMLGGGCGLADPAPDGRTFEQLINDIRSSPAFAAAEDQGPGEAVLARAAALDQVSRSDDGAFLVQSASASDVPLAVALAATQRLAQLGWPKTLEEWSVARGVVGGLRRSAAAVEDADRASVAGQRIDAAAQTMWKHCWRESDRSKVSELAILVGDMEEIGVKAESLDAADRFNVLVIESRNLVAAGTADPAEVGKNFTARASSVADLPESAARQVALVQAAIDAQAALERAGPPLDRLGPGSLEDGRRWRLEASGEDWVIFAPPAGSGFLEPIEFIRVRTATHDAFVTAREVSIAVFASAIGGVSGWADVVKFGRIEVGDSLQRKGPAAWVWTLKGRQVTGIQAAPAASRSPSRGWFDLDRVMTKTSYYEAGKEPPPPSRDHPMQYVAPASAVFAARAMGCRLPTVDEATVLVSIPSPGRPNRRDASWAAANEVLAKRGNGRNITWFDEEIFLPEGEQFPRRGKAVAAVNEDDGSVMLRPVSADSTPHAVHDAIGNVAELVFEDLAAQDRLPTDAAGLREAMLKTGALRVIGASAFSPPEIVPARSYVVRAEKAAAGYSDVGFRLAFSAAGASGPSNASSSVKDALVGLELVNP